MPDNPDQANTSVNPPSAVYPTTPAVTPPPASVTQNVAAPQTNSTPTNIEPDVSSSPPPSPKKKINKKIVVAILGLLVLAGSVGAGVILVGQQQIFEQKAAVREATGPFAANITDNSFSIWWRGTKSAKGCVTITPTTGGNPQEVCGTQKTNAHLVNFRNLTPETGYKVGVKHGSQSLSLSPFFGTAIWTRSSQASTAIPVSAFGQVINIDQKPVPDATIFITPNKTDRFYMPVAAQTDSSGNFKFDNLQLIDQLVPGENSEFILEVINKEGVNLIEQVISRDNLSPVPTITVPN